MFATHIDDIKSHIFKGYDTHARPSDGTTDMKVNLAVTHFDIDEDKNIFTIFGWSRMVIKKYF